MSTHKNRVKMTVSGTPGTGTITLNAASSGYQSFATAYGGNATVDILIVEGTAWEVARDCTYTNSGTTVTRGTLEASSTGSAVSFTSAAVVSVIATADRGRTWDAASLNTQVAGTDANTTMAANTLYTVDMSAWATADRTYTLPATAAVGDRIGIMVTAGNASFELILTAGTGDTLNGVAGGTEWSRVFISNEVIVMRCVVANTTWIVEYDGRQKAYSKISRTTVQAITTGTNTKVQCATVVTDPFGMADTTTNYRITVRRGGNYSAEIFTSIGALADQYRTVGRVYKNGSLDSSTPTMYMSTASSITGSAQGSFKQLGLAAGDYLEVWVFWDGTTGTKDTGTGGNSCTLLVTEE